MTDLSGIILARHGETDDNVEPIRAQGWRDTPLNEKGRAQAGALADRLAGEEIRAIWSSDLSRARDTARAVAERVGMPVQEDARLREGSRGRWEGFRFVDIASREPDLYAAWRRGGSDFRFPDGESLAEHQARVIAALQDIHRGPLPALVVTHGGSIRCMLCRSDPAGLDAFHRFEVPNTALFRL